MSCKTIQAKLSAYLDGEMSGTEMMSIRSHVNACGDCQKELDSLKSIQMILRGMPSGPEAPEHIPARINQLVSSKKRRYVGVGFAVAIPAIIAVVAFYPRPVQPVKAQERNIAINRQLASDQVLDAGNDSTSGASLVHYTSFEGR